MRIALTFPPFFLDSMYNLPPLGLINIASALPRDRHDLAIFDFVLSIRRKTLSMGPSIYDDCARQILDFEPGLVGFSTQCTTYPAVVQIARRLKKQRPGLTIVLGGHNASFVDVKTLQLFPEIDMIVRGEGEITFPELVERLEEGGEPSGIPGVTWRSGGEVVRNSDRELMPNLDDLSPADYTLVPSFTEYRDSCDLPRSIAILEVGRGCPHHCVYCSESLMWRRRTRTYSVDRIIREMVHLRDTFGAECFLLAYDQFTARRQFVEEFCQKVVAEGLNSLPWYCISRLDTVDAGLLGHMREAGCESMCYGIDSGSKKTLAFIRKNIDHSVLFQRVVETTAQGIAPTLSYVIGFPEEEQEDIDATLTLALRTSILGNVNTLIQMPTVLAGTDLQNRYGDRLVRSIDTYFSLGLEFDHDKRLAADEELINSSAHIFSSFYNIPCRALSLEDLSLIADYFPLLINLYSKSFYLLSSRTGRSPSTLFLHWMKWVQEKAERTERSLSPQDCYRYFESFAEHILEQMEQQTRNYCAQMLDYETTSIEAAKFNLPYNDFIIDLNRLREFKPEVREGVIVKEFAFNLPEIVEDLKQGIIRESYEEEPSVLVFTQHNDQLEVTEINDFGRDLLHLCDGRNTLHSISERLYSRYGGELGPEKFYEECLEAARSLGQMDLIRS